MIFQPKQNSDSGFTLVEVIVALGVFVTIAAIGSGVFLQVVRSQRNTFDDQEAAQQMRLFQDLFSRDVRASSQVVCGVNSVDITNIDTSNPTTTRYVFSSDGIQRQSQNLVTVDLDNWSIGCGNGEGDSVLGILVNTKLEGVTDPYQFSVVSRFDTRFTQEEE